MYVLVQRCRIYLDLKISCTPWWRCKIRSDAIQICKILKVWCLFFLPIDQSENGNKFFLAKHLKISESEILGTSLLLKTNSINLLTGSYHKISSLLSRLTGTLSGYFLRIFSPSARRFSKGCSSLYSHFIYLLWKGLNTPSVNIWSEEQHRTSSKQKQNGAKCMFS